MTDPAIAARHDSDPHDPHDRPGTPPPTVIKLRGPADLLEMVPYLFGFRPTESLVAVSIKPGRNRVGVQLRADLGPASEDRGFPAYVASLFKRERADSAVLVVYTEAPTDPDRLPAWSLVSAVREALAAERIELRDALCVRDGRWWSYVCADPSCCPPEGTVLPADSASRVAAEATVAGLQVLPDRNALAESLRPVGFLGRLGVNQAIDRALAERAEELAAAEEQAPQAVAEVWRRHRRVARRRLWAAAERAYAGEWLTDAEVGELSVALSDIATRDSCVSWDPRTRGEAAQALWIQLARRADLCFDATPMFLVAWTAWRCGNGALAQIALERTLEADPGYSFALLLDEALDRAVNPAVLDGEPKWNRRGPSSSRRRGKRR